jgi:putative hemolysin
VIVEILIVVALVVLNGFLAMSELAVVSARPVRLKVLEEAGSRGAAVALRLAEAPGRFISTVQIGITLVGVLSGAFSGATLGLRLTAWLEGNGVDTALADALGVGVVVLAITYLSLVVGELVPKQIALRNPERVASRVAPAMLVLSRLAAPLVWLLDVSGRAVLALLGQSERVEDRVTEEEVRTVIAEATTAGVLELEERSMIAGVMRLADRAARGLMTPRREVEMIDLTDPAEKIDALLRTTRRSRLPVHEEEPDAVIGVVLVREVLAATRSADGDPKAAIRAALRPAPVVRDGAPALDVVRALRGDAVHLALVYDEYGHFEGIVTAGDVLEAITGVFVDETTDEPAIVQREDGSWLVSGWMPVDEFAERIGFPLRDDPDYETVAGLVLDNLNHLPEVGEHFTVDEWRVEVVDLDGRRIDKILVSRLA